MSEEKKRTHRTIEERQQLAEQKLEKIKETIKNRAVRKVWTSEFRQMKSELNNNKELNYIEKIQSFVNMVYQKTGIYVIVDIEEEFEQEEE